MVPANLATLRYWMAEREHIRQLKDVGAAKPWTDDIVLQNYRFCNVHREDDTVTRWLKANWRDPYDGHTNMVGAMAMARLVNWPDTLHELGFPEVWDKDRFVNVIAARRAAGKKSWTGAYMITAEMGNDAPPKEVSVAKTIDWFMDPPWEAGPWRAKELWEDFQDAPRVGSFIAAQIVADLKHTHILRNAPDKETFCAPGPGSMSGLNWLLGKPLLTNWRQKDFEEEVNRLRESVMDITFVDAQDMQNCLCEIFKYQRGSSRSKYPGV
jgi:hypothetical protein